jgi:hypothetical protein
MPFDKIRNTPESRQIYSQIYGTGAAVPHDESPGEASIRGDSPGNI